MQQRASGTVNPEIKMNIYIYMFSRFVVYYGDVIMGAMASQITSLTTVYSTVYSDADQRKHQSSASLAFVWAIHRWPVNSPHKWPVTRKMFSFDDVIMFLLQMPKRDDYAQADFDFGQVHVIWWLSYCQVVEKISVEPWTLLVSW